MTSAVQAALIDYSKAYHDYWVNHPQPHFNLEVAVKYATADLWNQVKHTSDPEHQIAWIADEALMLREALAKREAQAVTK